MKKALLLVLFFLQILRGVTTAQNIYASIGKEAEVLTLSSGKYQEFFPNDTIVRIGTVLLNTKTQEIVEFVTASDTAHFAEADVASRFLSVDPIGREYPELTPYQFASNTPIQAIDLDGLEAGVMVQYSSKVIEDGSKYVAEWWNTSTEESDANTRNIHTYQLGISSDPNRKYTNGEKVSGQFAASMQAYGQWLFAKGFRMPQSPKAQINKNTKPALNTVNVSNDKSQNESNYRGQINDDNLNGQTRMVEQPFGSIPLKDPKPQIGGMFKSYTPSISNGRVTIPNKGSTQGNYDFIVTNEGELVIGKGHYFLSGGAASVKAAGQISIKNGKVVGINNSSGHYKPSSNQGENGIKILSDMGINLKGAKATFYKLNAEGKVVTDKHFIINP